MQPPVVPRIALVLGWAGVVPFFLATVVLWSGGVADRALAASAQVGYGAVILSFLGAIHWGLVLSADVGGDARSARWRLVWGVQPALASWVALLVPPVAGIGLLAVGMVGAVVVDLRAVASGRMPLWYGELRRPLTAVVVVLLTTSAAALLWLPLSPPVPG
jgi:hypothetical protein